MPKTQEEKVQKQEVVISPHLALTHSELNSGAANGRNVSLLMKSLENLTDKQKELLKGILGGEDFLEKMSNNGVRKKLSRKLEEVYPPKYSGDISVYLLDFDEDVAVFNKYYDGLYAVNYSISDSGDVALIGAAYPVNEVISYEESSGNIVLSEAADGVKVNPDTLEKSVALINKEEALKENLKTIINKGKEEMEQQIQKAVDAAKAPLLEEISKANAQLEELQKSLESVNKEKEALQEALQEIEKAQKLEKEAKRLEKLSEVFPSEEEAVEMQKSLQGLDDEAFENVVKAFSAKKQALQKSDMFTRVSETSAESGEQQSGTAQMLKAKYAQGK